MKQIVVGMADCRVSTVAGQFLTTFALGSCIALAVHDARVGVGGLLHFMLPDAALDPERARANPFLFANTGVPLLLKLVWELGGTRRGLTFYAAGGAKMIDRDGVFGIGKRNYLAARKALWEAGFLLSGEAVGGKHSRTLRLEVGSGRVRVCAAGSYQELRAPGRSR